MDYLEQPGIREKYEKCKLIVKIWEHQFTKKHRRLPSKLDIREASIDVRNAYKKYFQLKSAALERSFKDIDGFEDEEDTESFSLGLSQQSIVDQTDMAIEEPESTPVEMLNPKTSPINENIDVPKDIWGTHLNHLKEIKQDKKDKKENPNLSITKKLFCGSKFTKRNPRKSLSFSQKTKSNLSVDDNISSSQPVINSKNEINTEFSSFPQPLMSKSSFPSFDFDDTLTISQNENWFGKDTFQIQQNLDIGQSQSVNVIQSVLESKYKSLKSVDPGWLQRIAQKTGVEVENQENPIAYTTLKLPDKSGKPVSFQNKTDNIKVINTKLDYESEDIIEDSDDESCYKDLAVLHVSKKRKIDQIQPSQLNSSDFSNPNMQQNIFVNNCQSIQSHVETDNCMDVEDYEKIIAKASHNKTDDRLQRDIVSIVTGTTIPTPAVKKKTRESTKNKTAGTSKSTKVASARKSKTGITPRRSTRETRVKVNLQEFSSGEEEPFKNDEEGDPEFHPEDNGKKKNIFVDVCKFELDKKGGEIQDQILPKILEKKKRTAKKRSTAIEELAQDEEENGKPYDLEFSVKPRLVAPRYSNLTKIITENKIVTKASTLKESNNSENNTESLIKTKQEIAKQTLEKKIAGGNLNDNFVRINMKKKVFVRGKSAKSFSKYKKAQWKAKKAKALCGPDMDMGGCDGGMLTCFNCGHIGHFAKDCKALKGDSLLPKSAEINEECPFLTLEEASQMAQGSLKVRVPNFVENIGKINYSSEEKASKDTVNRTIECFQEDIKQENNEINFNEDEIDSDLLYIETLKLEEQVRKLDVQQYLDKVTVVEPYYQTNEDGSIIATPSEVYGALHKFGFNSFRTGQEQAIMRILSGKSTLVTLSTGSGKSLCYQLPAYLYSKREPCISLIISPLVSLMDDQILGIAKFMKAACLHSNQTKSQRQKILDMIIGGDLSVLLVSPEAVVAGERQTGFGSFLRKLPPIAFACIDEAHCVSQWSHNFRPSYLLICRVLRESLGVKTILGLTATATRATRESIIRHVCIPDGENGVISDIPLPDNLLLTVSKEADKDNALVRLLMSQRFADCKSVIIYCTRRDECERIASFLRTYLKSEQPISSIEKKRKRLNFQAEPYHAGLSASRRRTIQNSFMSGALRIVVATVAFGMGINKSDIRAVIHYNMPKTFESYVQEIGRAGRDGLKAHCHVFLDMKSKDENELRRHIHANSIERHTVRKLLQKVFIPCSCKGLCFKHEVAFSIESTVRALDIPEENISTLLCYLELHPNKYIELLSPAYTWCKIISYGGPLQIKNAAKDCAPLAMALALHKSKADENPNLLEFPVIEIASAMGWESGICKHKLKSLEWTIVDNQPRRSSISVQLSDLGFRLLSPGNLVESQLDEALDNLYNRVVDQEEKALLQLNAVHKTLLNVAKPSFQTCSIEQEDFMLKTEIRQYFNSTDPLSNYSPVKQKPVNEEQLVNDIHAIISMYRDNNFTGRAIARIFHGIQSPNYPAVIWGRCKFWRKYLETSFHDIVKIATREIIKMR